MPILNQPLRHSLHTEGTEGHVCGCCFRFVDLGIGSCSIDERSLQLLRPVPELEPRPTTHAAWRAVVSAVSLDLAVW